MRGLPTVEKAPLQALGGWVSRHSPPGASWWSVYPPPPSQCLVGSLTERKNKVKVSQRVKIKVSVKVITRSKCLKI